MKGKSNFAVSILVVMALLAIPVFAQDVPDIISYGNSPLNPGLKILSILIFGVSVYLFYRAKKIFEGSPVGDVAKLLMIIGIFGTFASLGRYMGDIVVMNKWFESLFFLLFIVVGIFSGMVMLKKFVKIEV